MKFISLVAVIFAMCTFWMPQQAFAESCACYCRSEDGAKLISANMTSQGACDFSCQAQDLRTLGCYTEDQQDSLPENNPMCWTKAACIADEMPIRIDESGTVLETAPSDWGGQENFCPENEGYCYNPRGTVSEWGGSEEVELGVAIGSLTSPTDLVDYIASVYGFILGVAGLLAVVIFMVAGVQMMTSGGNSAKVTQAKGMMGNVAVGLVLLLSVYVIANFIDPRLTTLDIFRLPKVQTVVFLNEGSSCETIMAMGIPVDYSGEQVCGATGIVGDVSEATGGNLSVGLEEGDPCYFTTCSDERESCIATNTSDSGFACVSCRDIFDGSDNGLEPSESVCSNALSQEAIDTSKAAGDYAACLYFDASLDDIGPDACIEVSYGDDDDIDCDLLREKGWQNNTESCRIYDLVRAQSTSLRVDENEVDQLAGEDDAFAPFVQLCEDDPCGVGYPSGSGCKAIVRDYAEICDAFGALGYAVLLPFCLPDSLDVTELSTVANCVDQNYYEQFQKWDIEDWLEDYGAAYEAFDATEVTDMHGNPAEDPYW